MRKAAVLATLVVLATGTIALAHKGATGVMKERMDMMSALGDYTKSLAMMVRGRTALDWQVVEQAGSVAANAGEMLPHKFPADSFKAPSEAKQTIISEIENFTLLSNGLSVAGSALKSAASNQDEGAFMVAFQSYAATCKACHSLYRE